MLSANAVAAARAVAAMTAAHRRDGAPAARVLASSFSTVLLLSCSGVPPPLTRSTGGLARYCDFLSLHFLDPERRRQERGVRPVVGNLLTVPEGRRGHFRLLDEHRCEPGVD